MPFPKSETQLFEDHGLFETVIHPPRDYPSTHTAKVGKSQATHSERTRARLLASAPEIMNQRRCLAEHPFAQIKCGVMTNGRFLLRGLAGARAEMALAVLVRNLRRVMTILGNRALIGRLTPA